MLQVQSSLYHNMYPLCVTLSNEGLKYSDTIPFLTVRMSGVTCVISTSYLAPHRGNREVKNPLIREKNNFGLTAVYQIFERDEYQAILSFQKHNSFSRFPPFLVQKQQQTRFNHSTKHTVE